MLLREKNHGELFSLFMFLFLWIRNLPFMFPKFSLFLLAKFSRQSNQLGVNTHGKQLFCEVSQFQWPKVFISALRSALTWIFLQLYYYFWKSMNIAISMNAAVCFPPNSSGHPDLDFAIPLAKLITRNLKLSWQIDLVSSAIVYLSRRQ